MAVIAIKGWVSASQEARGVKKREERKNEIRKKTEELKNEVNSGNDSDQFNASVSVLSDISSRRRE